MFPRAVEIRYQRDDQQVRLICWDDDGPLKNPEKLGEVKVTAGELS